MPFNPPIFHSISPSLFHFLANIFVLAEPISHKTIAFKCSHIHSSPNNKPSLVYSRKTTPFIHSFRPAIYSTSFLFEAPFPVELPFILASILLLLIFPKSMAKCKGKDGKGSG
jgi:hypothetical protein